MIQIKFFSVNAFIPVLHHMRSIRSGSVENGSPFPYLHIENSRILMHSIANRVQLTINQKITPKFAENYCTYCFILLLYSFSLQIMSFTADQKSRKELMSTIHLRH